MRASLLSQAPTADGNLVRMRQPAAADLGPLIADRYQLLESIGSGGMGSVFAAFDRVHQRKVALKLSSAAPRVQREIDAMSCIFDDHVVALYDAGKCGDLLYLVMELVEGWSLRQWLRHTCPPLSSTLDIVHAVGRGLVAVHDAGIVHRDIKPSNVLLGFDDQIKIADFGLAIRDCRLAGHAAAERSSALDAALTKDDSFVGTTEYAAPEQLRNQIVDARADQFSFCAVLFELVAGRRLFGRAPRVLVKAETIAEELGRLGAAGVPRRVIEVMQRGLAFDPEQRFADFRDLLGTLTA